MAILSILLPFVIALIGGWLIPWVAMKVIMTARFKSGKQQTTNYAGNTVSYGLSLVWLVWAASLFAMLMKGSWLTSVLPTLFADSSDVVAGVGTDSILAEALMQVAQSYNFDDTFFVLAIPLVVTCFFFGWLDDRFGARGDGGFKGHIRALFRGKVTTGMAKVLGIGFVALIVAIYANGYGLFDGSVWNLSAFDALWIFLSMCAIALGANLINLFDLRPARASKVYVAFFLQVFFIASCSSLVIAAVINFWNPWDDITTLLMYLLWALGPIFAIWRYDAGERAMLGDAGANPAGALIGLYAVVGLWILLPVYVVIVLTLNMLSEKFSFTKLIEGSPILKTLDMWGRPRT
ncbi:MAG: hypothetical protein FWE48_00005 [Coriobacteriia bacterium]|nr:hypothetical protein [Coriobacteriia bacterium]MCL2745471.1 hypothetical protein [Coriobacteriia bacterium]MCL2871216.1 hypothetical protein [Coriobacteriia bacterium]